MKYKNAVALGGMLIHASCFAWSSNEVQFLYGNGYKQPRNNEYLTKSILTLQHASGVGVLRSFAFVDFQWTDGEKTVARQPESTREFYGEYYGHISISKISGRSLEWGLIKDINFVAGTNLGAKENDLKQRTKVWLVGVSVDVALPSGWFNLMISTYDDHSWNRLGTPDYKMTTQITPSWGWTVPGAEQWSIGGYVDFIGSKGLGTSNQISSQIQIRYDIGQGLIGPKRLYLGVEYQYFRNKFGVKGTRESVPQALLVMSF